MKKVKVITFKGCQTAIDLIRNLKNLVLTEKLDAEIEMVIVPSPAKASRMKLYGSPTILVDGLEYQGDRRGPPGFY